MRTVRQIIATSVGLLTLFAATAAVAQVDRNVVTKRKTDSFWGKFKSSMFSTSVSMGVGTFYSKDGTFPGHDGPDNAYVAQSFSFMPRFNIAKAQSVRLSFSLDCEYTDPDRNPGRHCNQSDIGLSYNHNNLWKDPFLSGVFYGSAGLYLPVSYASLNNNTVMNVRLSGGYLVNFFSDRLEVGYGFGVQKYLPTSHTRDSVVTSGSISPSDANAGSTGSGSRYNDNWMLMNRFHLGFYFTKRWSVSLDLAIMNYFRFSAPGDDSFTSENAAAANRADLTWGTFAVGYKMLDWVALSAGVQSYQAALTPQGNVRFPFYDFVTPQSNMTSWFVSASAIY